MENTNCCSPVAIKTTNFINATAFTLAVKVDGRLGNPVAGADTYRNSILKDALDVNYCFLAKQVLTIRDGDMTFDPGFGEVGIYPNVFAPGDSLIINYKKNI